MWTSTNSDSTTVIHLVGLFIVNINLKCFGGGAAGNGGWSLIFGTTEY